MLTKNHRARRAIKVENGIAAELEFAHKTKLSMKNSVNTILKKNRKSINIFKFYVQWKLKKAKKFVTLFFKSFKIILRPFITIF